MHLKVEKVEESKKSEAEVHKAQDAASKLQADLDKATAAGKASSDELEKIRSLRENSEQQIGSLQECEELTSPGIYLSKAELTPDPVQQKILLFLYVCTANSTLKRTIPLFLPTLWPRKWVDMRWFLFISRQ